MRRTAVVLVISGMAALGTSARAQDAAAAQTPVIVTTGEASVRLEQEFDNANGRRVPRDFLARNALEVTVVEPGLIDVRAEVTLTVSMR